MPTVAIYTRPTIAGQRQYTPADPAKKNEQGTFYLRYKLNGKRTWETTKTQIYTFALAAARKREAALLTGAEPVAMEKPAPKLSLSGLKTKFLEFKQTTCKRDGTPLDGETIDAYKQQTEEFLEACRHEYPADVDAMDLRRYMAALRERGLTHRSVCNNYTSVACFLKFCGVDHKNLLPYGERPTPDDGTPEAYEEAEMRRFFAALTRERDRLAFEVLLKTGLREREMTTLEWADLNLGANPTVTVQPRKPHLKFRTKTGKGRTVPLEGNLALKLATWKMKNLGTQLLFGTASDKEDYHYWRICKETAKRAGMDPAQWWLHKFRDTFGTWTCRAGKVDLRTLQHWMGHSSITMTERYLAPGQGAYAQDGINQTFNVNIGEDVKVMAAVQ